MTFTVLDTGPAMREILHAAEQDRADLLRTALEPAAGLYRFYPGEPDLIRMHRMGPGFPLDRDVDLSLDGLRRLEEANAWERIGDALRRAATLLERADPGLQVPDATVLLVLGHPTDEFFHDVNLGMTANGSMPGYLYLNVWPSPENLARLEATAVHELNHNARYAPGNVVWDPATVTVGEYVVSEGLADAFARELYGDELGRTRIGVPLADDDEVFRRVLTGLDVTGMQNFSAWVFGDAHAARFGGEPVGLPTGAGYAAGNRLVDTYLAQTGRTASECLLAPAAEVIAASV
ncbi:MULTISPECIES: DUF2268 domain-containing protein [Pseudonocardia]|uniref:DUF2268 domain-containing protein n=2 Tax=Pseudonocardia TaxID=1847 RepID=A0A1Y2MKX0_PSEAH|nr:MULTISPECIES: DUF2268 domain-containing putative Zn-dependent protease [Pseudonocardia]OSY35915.1 hypothetical protein BG845_05753 [Pseudonocardia autotrophica]TDN73977.1 uncharacterized protein YjaZ [Pseudonocardia autotrophica]BBG04731.1 hypothetical protein Pdca_59400 [Pseudonocardia autotrophica]GEC28920.1 hypothetical protein PSA01_59490 [Pseudonocardia saturnea]